MLGGEPVKHARTILGPREGQKMDDSRVPGEFTVHVAADQRGGTVVTVYGELDMASAPRLRRELERVIDDGAAVTIDLRACGFIDSTGIATLVAAAWRVKERGRVLRIRGVRARIRRTFDLAGLSGLDSVVLEPGD
jgi:anti-sigma B factor antagonist